MLRTKQLGTLSQSARSFFLSGTRCSADGSSCTCPEDEACTSKRQIVTNNGAHIHQTKSNLVPKSVLTPSKTESKRVDHSASHPLKSTPLVKNECVSYADEIDTVQPSSLSTGHFVRAGIAAVNFLNDVVNYKIPLTEGSSFVDTNQNFVVQKNRSSTVKTYKKVEVDATNLTDVANSSNVKTYKKVEPQASGPTTRPNANIAPNVSKVRPEKYASGNSQSQNQYTVKSGRKKSKDCVNHFVVGQRAPEYQAARTVSVREARGMSTKPVYQTGRQFLGSGHVVESVSQILRHLKWGPAAEEALWNLNCSLDAYQANQVLKQLQDPSVALSFFYWLKKQPGFKHDGHTYTTMVGILGRAKQFGAINKLLDQMVQDGYPPNVVTYNRLIHSYGRANFLNKSLDVFEQMQREGIKPDRVTYCTLIDIHAKAGYLDVAMGMYQRMQEAGLSPDTFTFSVIINCLGKAGHLDAALKLFYEMVNQGCVPNLVTYNIMIALQAKARNYPIALQLYRDMQNAGFEPDKVTYSIVMEVYGHCGYLEEAEEVFKVMTSKNWVPDEPVYGLLVDLWGKSGNVEKAWGWYRAMLNAGLLPNVPTCNSLLSAFLRVHRLSDAYNLVRSMHSLGLNPSLQTYTLLLSCCTEAQTSFDMRFCYELMQVTGHPADAFLRSMPSAGPDGQNVRDHASGFLDLMHSEDRESKRGLIDAVVDFLHKSGLREEAGSVWEVAAQKNVYPDAVHEKSACYWLINLHVMSDGTAVTALSRTLAWFRREMLASGICPSRIDIVTGWGRRSRVTGSSLVRQSVQELLSNFRSPFTTENGNSGCFVGWGEPLSNWLGQSYVERMHLL
ncbi:pentatricopeptide repeat-containing protein At1g74750-like [Rutidosis leptorrhynchoides]|uniref:pentatricopeptide repeat-containing protein At1g74750-like n=1 Tax=Rutidosis leptorrhynchoides TaxID=125765 RepID=UPI003A98EE63